jgi:hypothetical protein
MPVPPCVPTRKAQTPPQAARTEVPPKIADALESVARGAPLGAAASFPPRARPARSSASEAGGRVGVGPGLYDVPTSELTGGAHSSSRLAPYDPLPSRPGDEPHDWRPGASRVGPTASSDRSARSRTGFLACQAGHQAGEFADLAAIDRARPVRADAWSWGVTPRWAATFFAEVTRRTEQCLPARAAAGGLDGAVADRPLGVLRRRDSGKPPSQPAAVAVRHRRAVRRTRGACCRLTPARHRREADGGHPRAPVRGDGRVSVASATDTASQSGAGGSRAHGTSRSSARGCR